MEIILTIIVITLLLLSSIVILGSLLKDSWTSLLESYDLHSDQKANIRRLNMWNRIDNQLGWI